VVPWACLTTSQPCIGYRLLMAFQHVILALLEEGPSHGWQMKSRIEAAVGTEYGGLNRGYIYEVIHKMERDGLITSRVEPQAGPRPDRTVHEITEAGREQLTGWLAEPVRPSAGFRDEFVQKVLAASMRGPGELRRFCRLQRQALLAESKTLQTLRRERADDPAAAFTIEVAILRTNAELECVEVAEARAGQRLVDLQNPVADASQYQPRADSQIPAIRRRADGSASLLRFLDASGPVLENVRPPVFTELSRWLVRGGAARWVGAPSAAAARSRRRGHRGPPRRTAPT